MIDVKQDISLVKNEEKIDLKIGCRAREESYGWGFHKKREIDCRQWQKVPSLNRASQVPIT